MNSCFRHLRASIYIIALLVLVWTNETLADLDGDKVDSRMWDPLSAKDTHHQVFRQSTPSSFSTFSLSSPTLTPKGGVKCEAVGGDSNVLLCYNGSRYVPEGSIQCAADIDVPLGPRFWIDIAVSCTLIAIAGLMSGLTMGLMSIDIISLQILANGGGTEKEKTYANRILPLVRRHHLLLVTLLVGNAAAMEALPIFLDRLAGPIVAILMSVTAVLLFGEIIPQAICTRYGLAIGAHLFWLVWLIIILFFPITFPISKLLDFLLGGNHVTYFRRTELKELVALHEQGQGKEEDHFSNSLEEGLTKEEVHIIKGALDMSNKRVKEPMTPIHKLLESGHSRVPVYRGHRANIIGMILVKKLIKLNPKDAVPLEELEIFRLPSVPADVPLYAMLKLFQRGGSHMAIVLDPQDHVSILGIITLEDVIEELIQDEIQDETDVYIDIARSLKATQVVQGHRPKYSFSGRSFKNVGSISPSVRRRLRDSQPTEVGREGSTGSQGPNEGTFLLEATIN